MRLSGTRRWRRVALGALGSAALATLAPAGARADVEPLPAGADAPDAAGTGAPEAAAADEVPTLPEIVDLMHGCEEALAEADADIFTQRQQERIVEALTLGDDVVERLRRLIEDIESKAGT